MQSTRLRRSRAFGAHLVALLVIFSSFAACAADAPSQPGAAQPQPAATQPQPAAAPAPGTTADYIIGPGDTLQIYVWQHNDLSVTVPVRPDGKISTPLVEDLVAVNKTPFQLARDVEARLKEYVRTPQVNVIVTTTANAFNQVKVIGQVAKPGSLPFRAGMTALDAILQVGGLSEFAAGNRATLVREGANGKSERIRLRLQDLVKKGKTETNVELRPGDMIVVPESVF